jgi:hypothetical protein
MLAMEDTYLSYQVVFGKGLDASSLYERKHERVSCEFRSARTSSSTNIARQGRREIKPVESLPQVIGARNIIPPEANAPKRRNVFGK